jgi:hypothetical protein
MRLQGEFWYLSYVHLIEVLWPTVKFTSLFDRFQPNLHYLYPLCVQCNAGILS